MQLRLKNRLCGCEWCCSYGVTAIITVAFMPVTSHMNGIHTHFVLFIQKIWITVTPCGKFYKITLEKLQSHSHKIVTYKWAFKSDVHICGIEFADVQSVQFIEFAYFSPYLDRLCLIHWLIHQYLHLIYLCLLLQIKILLIFPRRSWFWVFFLWFMNRITIFCLWMNSICWSILLSVIVHLNVNFNTVEKTFSKYSGVLFPVTLTLKKLFFTKITCCD